jgi:uncharacterized protein
MERLKSLLAVICCRIRSCCKEAGERLSPVEVPHPDDYNSAHVSPNAADDMIIPSPCIDVCQLDVNGVCVGCFRTLDEIARWLQIPDDERLKVLATLDDRRRITGRFQGENRKSNERK